MNPTMKQYFDELYKTTSELLDRIKRYERADSHAEEIKNMYVTFYDIEYTKAMQVNDRDWMERAVMKLENMKLRLLTIMEDRLYTA
ncbi:hypothetical protein DNH61_11205 [Paenibacillus sambharensis]|uniref:Uncharacterized protein n=1 Tax=Paenibacillus sambharensis TaxID=1803190 RepID=A0A2W1LW26_9BACL|nr:hypothetical protein [Paenibacillus sambharensis]PZD95991.1 hypothetical protein DNH61_11205 [Paenibacillus sambharensis]